MKIFFAAESEGGCAHYRAHLPAKYLKPTFDTDYYPGFIVNSPRTELADVMVLQRHIDPYFLDWIPKARAAGKIVLYDIDDTFWHIPPHNPAHKHYTKERRNRIEKIISLCDAVTTTTAPLAKWVARYNENVHILPNLVEIPLTERKRYTEQLVIGWAGSITHAGDFSKDVIKALWEVVKKYNALLVFFGWIPQELKCVSTFINPVTTSLYLEQLFLAHFDIGIAPLQKNFFNECKSNLKFLEYGVCSAAVVASTSYPYMHSITPETGICTDDFESALTQLCEDSVYRLAMQRSVRKHVFENYTWASQRAKVTEQYSQLIESLRR